MAARGWRAGRAGACWTGRVLLATGACVIRSSLSNSVSLLAYPQVARAATLAALVY